MLFRRNSDNNIFPFARTSITRNMPLCLDNINLKWRIQLMHQRVVGVGQQDMASLLMQAHDDLGQFNMIFFIKLLFCVSLKVRILGDRKVWRV